MAPSWNGAPPEVFKAIVENSNDAIVSRDLEGTILTWNAAAERLFGWSAAEVLGADIGLIIPAEQAPEVERNRARFAAGFELHEADTLRMTKDGRRIEVSRSMSPVKDAAGYTIAVSFVFRDISARKRAERTARLLADLAVETSRSSTPLEALQACLERICAHGNWRIGHVLMFERGGRFVPGTSVWKLEPADRERYADFVEATEHYEYATGGGVFASRILRKQHPLWLADGLPGFGRVGLLAARGMRSAFGFPVVSGGEVVALLEFFGAEPQPADPLLLKHLPEVAGQLARLVERERAHRMLADGERQLRLVAENIPAMVAYFDRELRCRFANSAYCRYNGFEPPQIVGATLELIMGAESYRSIQAIVDDLRRGVSSTTRVRRRAPEGEPSHIEMRSVVDVDANGAFRGFYALLIDVTEHTLAEEKTRQSEARLRAILDAEPECVKVIAPDGSLVEMNRAGLAMLEAETLDQVREHGVLNFVAPPYRDVFLGALRRTLAGEEARLEFEVIGLGGTRRWLETHTSPIALPGADATGALAVTRDVTERKRAEAQVAYLSQHDALTGLPNRSVFADRCKVALAHARRRNETVAVALLGLDRFGRVNETFGVGAGDELLRLVAARLGTELREGDTIARLGGDEFGVLVEGLREPAAMQRVAEKLLNALAEPFDLFGSEVYATASAGVAEFPSDAGDNLLENAGIAMRTAKAEGGGVRLFDASASRPRRGRLTLEALLRRALEREELEVHYQPRIDLSTGEVVGAEALARWTSAELGAVSPAEFIPAAEESGLIVPLGEWVLGQACDQAAAWSAGGHRLLVSVNLSPRQFRQKDLAEVVAGVLRRSAHAPTRLELEITEGTAMSNAVQTMRILEALSTLRVRIALDDFGTGYSSLAYLRSFPIDCLKIDRSFVHELERGGTRTAIVRATVALAHSLKMRVVAEGIETEMQRAYLRRVGCDEGQGFYYSAPLPAAQFSAYLAEHASPKAGRRKPGSASRPLRRTP
jgi:diguanylate cyclase (GGDEF)-like protein/PAS domain S-box-containing protein